MNRKTIAVDIDDVLAEGAQGFVEFSNKQWGTKLTIEDYTEHWVDLWGLSHEDTLKRAAVVYGSGLIKNFNYIDNAKPVLIELSKRYNLVITTSRMQGFRKDTLDWLDKYYQGIFKEVHFAGFYDELNEHSHKMTKAELCRALGADYIIDDHPKHCFAAAGAGVKALLFGDYRWNRNLELPKGVTRVKNWQEVKAFFDDRS